MNECPRCGQKRLNPTQVLNALSRTTRMEGDTPVYVCSPCGMDEALEDFFRGGATPQSDWHLIQAHGLINKEMLDAMERSMDIHITEQLEAQFE